MNEMVVPCGVSFSLGGETINLTAKAVAALSGIVLNAILPGNDYVFGAAGAKGDSSANLGIY